MTNLLDTPQLSPDGALQAIGAPTGFQDAFLSLTGPQRLWIIKRLNAPSLSEAARQAGVGENTVYTWRSVSQAFRLCEKAVLAAQGDSSLQLARAIYKAAVPEVAVRQVEQALEDHKGLSAQALMAQQRAREAVSKGAGMEAAAPVDADPLLAFISAVAKLRQAVQPSIAEGPVSIGEVSPSASERAQAQLRALQAPREEEEDV